MGLPKLNQKISGVFESNPRARHLAMLVIAALALTLSACDWTQFGYGASGGRSSPDTGIGLSNVASIELDWSATTGGSVDLFPSGGQRDRLRRVLTTTTSTP